MSNKPAVMKTITATYTVEQIKKLIGQDMRDILGHSEPYISPDDITVQVTQASQKNDDCSVVFLIEKKIPFEKQPTMPR